jgi:large subunit ribosomal protein L4
MKTSLYNQAGTVIGDVELDAKVFGVTPNRGVIEQAIVTHLANRRVVAAHTKTKGEVRGGGRKPWKQKGTGRARHGSIRSPQWKGGGVIFGPRKNRNFELKMNVSAKRKALLMALTDKLQHESVTVVDKIELSKAKTKDFAQVMKALQAKRKTVVVLPATDMTLVKSGRNIPGISFLRADSLNTYSIVNAQHLVVLQPSLDVIKSTFVK